jgi:hypothetical protein
MHAASVLWVKMYRLVSFEKVGGRGGCRVRIGAACGLVGQWTRKFIQMALLRAVECINIASASDVLEPSPVQVPTRHNVA